MPESFGDYKNKKSEIKKEPIRSFPEEISILYPWLLAHDKADNLFAAMAVDGVISKAFFNNPIESDQKSTVKLIINNILKGIQEDSQKNKALTDLSNQLLISIKEGAYVAAGLGYTNRNLPKCLALGLIKIANGDNDEKGIEKYKTSTEDVIEAYNILANRLYSVTLEYGLPALAESDSPTDPYPTPEIKKVEVSQPSLTDKLRNLFNSRNKK